MYSKLFGLRTLPFEDRADTQFFYCTAESHEVQAALVHEILHGTGLSLLIGEAGTGKTLLLRTLLLRLEKSHQTVVVTWPASGAMDLLRECCKGFGVTLPYADNQSRCLDRLHRHLGRCARAGVRSILIIDQAQNLSLNNIARLATLVELCDDRRRCFNIVLAAQPLMRALLDRPEFAWIRQQLIGERTLSPFTPNETGEYIRHRLRIAGAADARLFDDRAIALIHEVSEGVPRLINRACHAAMLVAYGTQTPRISKTTVEQATARTAVHERTVAARDLGSAMIGEGGAPWLRLAETPGRMASSDEAPVIPGSIASSVTPADILDHEGADDTGSGAKESSGASIVDGEFEGFNGECFTSGRNKGKFLLAKLERAIACAERMTNTTGASLSRLAVVEQHLASLVDRAERQTKNLRDLSEDTTMQLAKLSAETERATQILHEWVEEAVRTQARLERTLSECPSIRQTHPTDSLRRLSHVVEPYARFGDGAAGGRLQVLSEPSFDTTPVEPRVANQTTQAEEIARLISEAMRQEAPAPL